MGKATPIIISTYERCNYLDHTIKCLEQSNADLSELWIIDDCSTSAEKKKQLNELSKKYHITVNNENSGPYYTVHRGLRLMHEYYNAGCYIYLQDDVEVSSNWYGNGMEMYNDIVNNNDRFAILSLWNWKWASQKKWHFMTHGHFGALAWVVNARFWDEFQNVPFDYSLCTLSDLNSRDRHHIRNLVDWKICHAAHDLKWDIAHVGKSLVQHVGVKSITTNRDMTFTISKTYVGKNV